MDLWLAADPPFFGGPGQGSRQIVELFVAFGLTALIGLERELQGKSRASQTIVGTAAALILLVSKYGFGDVLTPELVVVDPSRSAAQIVSGIGFLGAAIIMFRRGSVHGLTTAAAIWESAAIGIFMPLARRLSSRFSGAIRLHVTYEEGRRAVRASC